MRRLFERFAWSCGVAAAALGGNAAWGLGFNTPTGYYEAMTYAAGAPCYLGLGCDWAWEYDRQLGTDAVAETDWTDPLGFVSYEGTAARNDLRGRLSTTGASGRDVLYTNGYSKFWDEIFFETASGEAAELEFNFSFHVDFDISTEISNYWMEVRFGTQRWDENGDRLWDALSGGSPLGWLIQTYMFYDDFDGNLAFSTLNNPFHPYYDGQLVDSGTYVPIYFQTEAKIFGPNGTIDWLNTFELASINAYLVDEEGNRIRQLSEGEYTLYSTAQPVPEPGTLLLLGSGLIGIGAAARRRALRR